MPDYIPGDQTMVNILFCHLLLSNERGGYLELVNVCNIPCMTDCEKILCIVLFTSSCQ